MLGMEISIKNQQSFDVKTFLDFWKDKKKSTWSKYVPRTAQEVCEQWIEGYATEAQSLMDEASEKGDMQAWRLYQYIRKSAFAIIKHEEPKLNKKYESATKRWMSDKLDTTLELYTIQYDAIRKQIAAKSVYAKDLRKILPQFEQVFDSLANAAEKLHKALKSEWLQSKENTTITA